DRAHRVAHGQRRPGEPKTLPTNVEQQAHAEIAFHRLVGQLDRACHRKLGNHVPGQLRHGEATYPRRDLAADEQVGAAFVAETQLALEAAAQTVAGEPGNDLPQRRDVRRQLDFELAVAVVEADRARLRARIDVLSWSAHAIVGARAHAQRIDASAEA